MPWKETGKMDERLSFIERHRQGERVTDLCREFNISRKTGHRLLRRWNELGKDALADQSRAPKRCAHRLSKEVIDCILGLKKKYPTWGAKKLRVKLSEMQPGIHIPARSTIHTVLKREGLVRKQRRRKRHFSLCPIRPGTRPNEVWCADFKGEFRLRNGKLCYPLTVTDHFSRYLIGVEALESTCVASAKLIFHKLFQEHGLSDAIRTDNGVPFATTGLLGLSELSAWWMALGIKLQRIKPGHPEQNGRHERMHLTLKQETTRPAGHNALEQQEVFDRFVRVFNEERPHEALNMSCPAHVYRPSAWRPTTLAPELTYPLHDLSIRANAEGKITIPRVGRFTTGGALRGQLLGVRELEKARWLVSYADQNLGVYDAVKSRFEAIDHSASGDGDDIVFARPEDSRNDEDTDQKCNPCSR